MSTEAQHAASAKHIYVNFTGEPLNIETRLPQDEPAVSRNVFESVWREVYGAESEPPVWSENRRECARSNELFERLYVSAGWVAHHYCDGGCYVLSRTKDGRQRWCHVTIDEDQSPRDGGAS